MRNTMILLMCVVFSQFGVGQPLNVNTKESTVKWVGKKITDQHDGTLGLKTGSIQLQDGKLSGGSFVMDMRSISCSDLSGGMKKKLEDHLKSEDFFETEAYPTASFIITKVEEKNEGNYDLTGNITIKAITEEIQFPATLKKKGDQWVANADFSFDRSKFGVKYKSGNFFENLGDKLIYDDIDLSIELVSE